MRACAVVATVFYCTASVVCSPERLGQRLSRVQLRDKHHSNAYVCVRAQVRTREGDPKSSNFEQARPRIGGPLIKAVQGQKVMHLCELIRIQTRCLGLGGVNRVSSIMRARTIIFLAVSVIPFTLRTKT